MNWDKLLEELTAERDKIIRVIEALTAGADMVIPPEPAVPRRKLLGREAGESPPVKPNGPAKPDAPKVSSGFKCTKHLSATFTPRGQCRSCKTEYGKAHYLIRIKNRRPEELPPDSRALPPVRCEACGDVFPDVIRKDQHRTKAHFTNEAGMRRVT